MTPDGTTVLPNHHFDLGKPFYPLVVNYLVSIHGILELVARQIIALAKDQAVPPDPSTPLPAPPPIGEPPSADRIMEFYSHPGNRTVTHLAMRTYLKCSIGDSIAVEPNALAEELGSNIMSIAPWTMVSAGILLISAWEITKQFSDQGPLWEFLRHCRNAAGHGGNFRFLYGEPQRPAAWHGIEVVSGLQGTPLFHGPNFAPGLLWPGDPISLLWEIEQAYPDMAI